MNSSNDCVICLNPLAQDGTPFGATTPCGHCFHEACFQQWTESQSKNNRKCPICNAHAKSFCRIYLDLSKLEGEDDAVSISSSSDNDDSYEEEQDHDDSDGKLKVESESGRRTCNIAKDGNAAASKFKVVAKRLKKQVRDLHKKLALTAQENLNDLMSLREEKLDLEKTIQSYQTELSSLTKQVLRVDEVMLRCTQLERTLRETNFKLSESQELAEKSQLEIQRLKACHQEELSRAQVQSMSEVKHLLDQHPKLVAENQLLKQKLQRLEQYCGVDSMSMTARGKTPGRGTMKILRTMHNAQTEHASKQDEERRCKEQDTRWSHVASKASSHAARLSRASDPNKRSVSASVDDILNGNLSAGTASNVSIATTAKRPKQQLCPNAAGAIKKTPRLFSHSKGFR
jgi:hypothetical protein